MPERIIVTGGTGFIGKVLCRRLVEKGYEVVVLSRNASRASAAFGGAVTGIGWDGRSADGWSDRADGAYGIVNLAGANIASGRWTVEMKEKILRSRLDAGRAVSEAVARASVKPRVLVQASAAGIYGDRGEERLDEAARPGTGFLSEVAVRWEESTAAVAGTGVRWVAVRTAIVLGGGGGFMERILPPFKFFLGGIPGNGRRWISWIHIRDEVDAIIFLLERSDLEGPFNLAAPQQQRARDFYRAVGRAAGRPSWLPVPAPLARLALGEMADELILAGQRVIPGGLAAAGFEFRYKELDTALAEILR